MSDYSSFLRSNRRTGNTLPLLATVISSALHAGLLVVVAFGVRAVRANQPEPISIEILEVGFAEIETEPPLPPTLSEELESTSPQIETQEAEIEPLKKVAPEPEPKEPESTTTEPTPTQTEEPQIEPEPVLVEDNKSSKALEKKPSASDADKLAPEVKERASPPTLAKPDPRSEAAQTVADERQDKGSPDGYADEGQEGDPFPFPEYLANIHRQVYRYFRAPQSARGTVTIQFTILRDGSTTMLRILESSHDPLLDYTAMAAIEMAGKDGVFGPLPQGYKKDRLVITFDFKPAQ